MKALLIYLCLIAVATAALLYPTIRDSRGLSGRLHTITLTCDRQVVNGEVYANNCDQEVP